MTKGKIATVISYCTNDFRFISKCIREAKHFSEQIIVVVFNHFFDGQKEDRNLLNHTYQLHPDCEFIECVYEESRLYSSFHTMGPDDPDWAIHLAGTARYIGFHYLKDQIDSVLFLDSDEIVESEAFLPWYETHPLQNYEVMRLAAYFYALKADLRGKQVVNLPLFVKKSSFSPLTLINELERIGAYGSHIGPKCENVIGLSKFPMVHHYSWVRTKEECYQKARTWGHRNDEDWGKVIEKAFSGDLEDLFCSKQEFEKIESIYFDPFQVSIPIEPARSNHSNLLKISPKEFRKKEIEYAFI